MAYLTYWLVQCRLAPAFLLVAWIGYILIIVTGNWTIFYAFEQEKQHWLRLFSSTCKLCSTLTQAIGHDRIEFSYSLWSEPLHAEGIPLQAALPQPDPQYSTRPLDIPQQIQWELEESIVKLYWLPVPHATAYELIYLSSPDSEEGWVTIYQGAEPCFTPNEPGWFRLRSLCITPPDDPAYEDISRILADTAMLIYDIGLIYTMRDYSEEAYVIIVCPAVDANYDGHLDPKTERSAPAGELYPRQEKIVIPPGDRTPYIPADPITNERGTWFHAVTALDRPDGTREGYVVVTYPVGIWTQNIYRAQIAHAVFVVIVLVMYFLGIIQGAQLHRAAVIQKTIENDLRRTIDELTEAKIMVEIAAQTKGYFLTNMSHEIRTPLNAMLGLAEILGRRLLDCCPPDQLDDNRHTIKLIETNSTNLLTVINDILDFAKVGTDQVEIEWVAIEPQKIMEDIRDVMSSRLKEKPQIIFHLEIDKSVPKRVYSDPARLRQILGNLCNNAVKFSEKGTIRFCCRQLTFDNTPEKIEEIKAAYGQAVNTALFTDDIPITLLQFVVQDEGIGIPKVLMPRLFQPFTQADASLTRKFGGTGLGLAIAKHLAALMGGDITVQSEEGAGTTFYVTFAFDVTRRQLDSVTFSGIVLVNEFAKPLAGMNILVVEDGKVNQIVITTILQDAGAVVQTAENGKLGIEAVEASVQGFDVILMDMQMPVMDGYEATSRLRQSGFTKPIIAVTAHALTGDMEKTLQVGCDAYMNKPVDRNKLIKAILKHAQSAVPPR